MTLLSIAQRVADEVGLPRPTSVAASTDQLGRQMFALANATLEELAEKDWPVLVVRGSITTVLDTPRYAMPADFHRIIRNTVQNAAQHIAVPGALSPAEWTRLRFGAGYGSLSSYRFRISENPLQITLSPTPQIAEILSFEYITANWATDNGGTDIPLYAQDTDTSIVPENLVRMGLKWRIKHAKGLDYSEDFNRYEAARDLALAQQMALGPVAVARRGIADEPYLTDGYVRENGYGV